MNQTMLLYVLIVHRLEINWRVLQSLLGLHVDDGDGMMIGCHTHRYLYWYTGVLA